MSHLRVLSSEIKNAESIYSPTTIYTNYDISAKTTSVVCGNSILPEGKLERNEIAFPLFVEITIRTDSLSLKFVQGSCERLISH